MFGHRLWYALPMPKKERSMPKVRVRRGTLPIPADIREELGVRDGDELEVSSEGGRIVLTPTETAGRHPGIDAAIAERLADARAGRVSPPFKDTSEFESWLETPEGKKFGRT